MDNNPKRDLHTIVIPPGPLNDSVKPWPFQTGGIFGCFIYIPFVGWVEKTFVLLIVAVVGMAAAVLLPLIFSAAR